MGAEAVLGEEMVVSNQLSIFLLPVSEGLTLSFKEEMPR